MKQVFKFKKKKQKQRLIRARCSPAIIILHFCSLQRIYLARISLEIFLCNYTIYRRQSLIIIKLILIILKYFIIISRADCRINGQSEQKLASAENETYFNFNYIY